MLMATLRAGGVECRVRVTDISKGGVKLKAAALAPAGTDVLIELPSLGWLAATIAWARGETCDLRFHREIDPAAARQAVTGSYARPAPPPPPSLRRVA